MRNEIDWWPSRPLVMSWDRLGASVTFHAGVTFCTIALVGLTWRPTRRPEKA